MPHHRRDPAPPIPWFALAVLCGLLAVTCNQRRARADVVELTQSGRRTTGAVIQIEPGRGTWILTCKHGRNPEDNWTAKEGARVVRGARTILDPHADLALLFTRQEWPGRATPVDVEGLPAGVLPVVCCPIRPLPPVWEVACWPAVPGESGAPLIYRGRVAGVLRNGIGPNRYYTRHQDLARFLMAFNSGDIR